MKRTRKILSLLLTALLLFLNVGLAVGFGSKLHAHILGNNEILIHFHNLGANGEHGQGHSSDASRCSFGDFSTTLTFLDSSISLNLKELTLSCSYKYTTNILELHIGNLYHTSPLRAPPFVLA
ncbi:hypothetical protein [Saccharicrinis aurantiacus]|uniref:hypothetical protein n=1 Tax=Saccharicrinis aurantiacus TaxID=1849719 RepID=UPI000838C6B9|nr:hypothetical protein [Saccharicrinis aurantiacus]